MSFNTKRREVTTVGCIRCGYPHTQRDARATNVCLWCRLGATLEPVPYDRRCHKQTEHGRCTLALGHTGDCACTPSAQPVTRPTNPPG